ncbi:energy-coupling factor transport system ATP-binding protein [Paenibacillus shirakamiensis]|uniref:Energy-coupling factor transport system ATP-binding protein n=1 Tax=Paenibacillus shirakamiensis TaxID=1265935 RepID=A0ABS4JDX0_9BACL|nr:energy-coupling factor transport system ATP-binding protein [Paenibacillus shirakamiensis]
MAYELNDVSVSYEGRTVLDQVSCIIPTGKWISIIGPTGAGKSTFVKVLKGLIPDIQGEYRINQHPCPRDARQQIKVVPDIGYVFQHPEHQIFETSVFKELAFGPKMQGFSTQQVEEAIELVLPKVGLTKDILPSVPFHLSGGEKRRIAIASVLITNPKVLILDEPTVGLDPVTRAALLTQLKDWQQQDQRTILFVSHQMEEVAEYSDEIMLFQEGRLLAHLDAVSLFIDNSILVERTGLNLPESIQLLKLVEELSKERIEVSSCKEQEIIAKILPIWQARGASYGE